MATYRACTVHVSDPRDGRTVEWTETFNHADIRDGFAAARHRALKELYPNATITRDDYRVNEDGERTT